MGTSQSIPNNSSDITTSPLFT